MKTLFLSLALFLSVVSVSAEQEAVTPDGRKVILNANGTWKYVEQKKSVEPAAGEGSCSTWIKAHEDKVTGTRTVIGSERVLVSDDGKPGFSIFTMRSNDGTIALVFTVVERGAGCMKEYGTINILFRDGSRLSFAHNDKFNCDGTASVFFGGMLGKRDILDQLKTKEIEIVRIQTLNSFVQRTFTPAQSKQLKNQLSCLDRETS